MVKTEAGREALLKEFEVIIPSPPPPGEPTDSVLCYIVPEKQILVLLPFGVTCRTTNALGRLGKVKKISQLLPILEGEQKIPKLGKGCIQDVQVNSSTVNKWEVYYIDFKNEKIIFFNGLSNGDTVDIQYKYGTSNWIYPDKPNERLAETAFPRMNILTVSASGDRLGQFEADVESALNLQIDIWTKEKKVGQIFTIDGDKYTGEGLADYLAFQVQTAFEDNESDLHPALYSYTPTTFPARDLPFNSELQCHHKSAELILKGINVGRIS